MAQLTCDIATPRLLLRLLDRATLLACLNGDGAAAAAAAALGLAVPDEMLRSVSSLRYTLAERDRDPGYTPWSTRAIVLRAVPMMAGYIRFHERPDPDRPHPFGGHAAELGYTVFAAHRRQGYAGEAAVAMMGWARNRGVRRFVASIAPGNVASRALAMRLGFNCVGRQIDEIDGPEDVFLRVDG